MTSPSNPAPDPAEPPQMMRLSPDLQPEYVNLVRITHSPAELVLDFARMLPGIGVPPVAARLLMSPTGAKLFLRALAENLARYEAAFGPIHLPGEKSLAGDLFGSIHPQQPPEGDKP